MDGDIQNARLSERSAVQSTLTTLAANFANLPGQVDLLKKACESKAVDIAAASEALERATDAHEQQRLELISSAPCVLAASAAIVFILAL
jgi:hypothetical protein